MKYRNFCGCYIYVLIILLLTACSSNEKYREHKRAVNRIKDQTFTEDTFMDFLVDESGFKVASGFTWHMTEEEFLNTVFGAETLNPDSDKFDELRRGTNDNNITSLSPPINISFKDYDWIVSPEFVFDENKRLTQIAYRFQFQDSEKSKYIDSLIQFIIEMDNNPNTIAEEREFDNWGEINWDKRLAIKWTHKNKNTAFRINSTYFREARFFDFIVSNVSTY